MSRVYWDTNLFHYWLYDSGALSDKVNSIYDSMERRGDILCSSQIALGELLVLPMRIGNNEQIEKIAALFSAGAIQVLPFDADAAMSFGRIRATTNAKALDAAHLACAASAGVDLFLTNDLDLQKLIVPGIQFIDGLDTTVLIK